MDSLTWVQLLAVIGVFGFFLILPLLSVVWSSFTLQNGAFTLSPHPGDSFQGGVSAPGYLVIMGGGTSAFVDRGIWPMFRR